MSGGPRKSWGSLAPIMTTTTCGIVLGQVAGQLGRPVEVVGPGEAGGLLGVDGGGDHPGPGQVGLEGVPQVDAERVPHDQDPQRGCRRGVPECRCRGGGHRSRRRAGDRVGGEGRRAHRDGAGRRRCGAGAPSQGAHGRPHSSAAGLADDPVGHRHEVGDPEVAAEGGDGPQDLERHRPPAAHRRGLGVALQGGGEQQQPDGEGHQAHREGSGPGHPQPAAPPRAGRRGGGVGVGGGLGVGAGGHRVPVTGCQSGGVGQGAGPPRRCGVPGTARPAEGGGGSAVGGSAIPDARGAGGPTRFAAAQNR